MLQTFPPKYMPLHPCHKVLHYVPYGSYGVMVSLDYNSQVQNQPRILVYFLLRMPMSTLSSRRFDGRLRVVEPIGPYAISDTRIPYHYSSLNE